MLRVYVRGGSFDIPLAAAVIQANMREYQLEALNWLIRLNQGGLNGILADEMVIMIDCLDHMRLCPHVVP